MASSSSVSPPTKVGMRPAATAMSARSGNSQRPSGTTSSSDGWHHIEDGPWPDDSITELEKSLLARAWKEISWRNKTAIKFHILEIDDKINIADDTDSGSSSRTSRQSEPIRRLEELSYPHLSERLSQIRKTIFTAPNPGDLRPRLRLLICHWYVGGPDLPFSSLDMAMDIIKSLNLPPTFPYHHELKSTQSAISFSRAREVTQKFGFSHLFLKTQLYRPDHSYSLALGYNSKSGCVSGLLNLSHEHEHLIEQICVFHKLASHPLLIPLTILQDLIKVADTQWYHSSSQLNQIEQMNISKGKSANDDEGDGKSGDYNNLDEVARTMAQLQENLESGAFDPLLNLVDDLDAIFSRAQEAVDERRRQRQQRGRSNGNGEDDDEDDAATLELCEQYRAARQAVRAVVQRKESIERGLQFQATLLYSRVARRDTAVALRDSAQMKAIATLTMVFLPTTALAAVFSMSPFFATDADTGHVSVNADFWLFFAVTVPITLAVLAAYVAWVQRAEIARLWKTARRLRATAAPRARNMNTSSDNQIPLRSLYNDQTLI